VGILGLGDIGKQLARRLSGFDCQILAYDPFADKTFAIDHGVILASMDTVIAKSDFLSLHLPLLPETQALLVMSFFQR